MATPVILEPKALRLILRAIEQRIASEEARYRVEDSGDDADGDPLPATGMGTLSSHGRGGQLPTLQRELLPGGLR